MKEKNVFNLWDYGTRPESLSGQESARLIQEYKKYGDESTKEKLIYGYLGYVQFLVNKYYKGYVASEDQINPSFEDLLETGVLSLIESIEKFDPDKGNFSFTTYFCHQLQSKMLSYHRSYKSRFARKTVSLDAPLKEASGDDSKTKLIDTIPAKNKEFDILHDRLELQYIEREILPLLSKRDRDIFVARFIQNKNMKQIADIAGCFPCYAYRILTDIQEKVKRMYIEGPTNFDRQLKGVNLPELSLPILNKNNEVIEKYGREFLRQYFLPTLNPLYQKIFEASVLNYRGQTFVELAKTFGITENYFTIIRKRIFKELDSTVEKLKQKQKDGQLPRPWKPTLKQHQAINRNERLIDQYGGRFFLQKYFVPTLSPVQQRVFIHGVLEFEGQSKTELAKKSSVSNSNYCTILKNVTEKLSLANFETLVDFIDNKKHLNKSKQTLENEIDLSEVERRVKLVQDFGGAEMLKKYFLPILTDKQRQVFELLYVRPTFSTLSGVASYLNVSSASVIKQEKLALAKLERTNLNELKKIDEMATSYLKRQYSQYMATSNARKASFRQNILSNYGGVAFLRDVFLPQISTKADKEIFEGFVLEGQPIKNFFHLFSRERKIDQGYYQKEVVIKAMRSRVTARLNDIILPQLQSFKESFPDFEQAVKDFYVRKGFEQIHPEDFEKMTFSEIKEITSEPQKESFISKELIDRAGGEVVVLKKFRPTLSLNHQLIFMKSYIEKMSDKQIAEDMQMTLPGIISVKESIVKKLEVFAEEHNKGKASTNSKTKSK